MLQQELNELKFHQEKKSFISVAFIRAFVNLNKSSMEESELTQTVLLRGQRTRRGFSSHMGLE